MTERPDPQELAAAELAELVDEELTAQRLLGRDFIRLPAPWVQRAVELLRLAAPNGSRHANPPVRGGE